MNQSIYETKQYLLLEIEMSNCPNSVQLSQPPAQVSVLDHTKFLDVARQY